MTKAERLLLTGEARLAGAGQAALELIDLGLLAAGGERLLKLDLLVEVILDHPLVAAGDEDEVLDTGGHRLVDHMLDQRPVDHRQHLLGHRLGGRKEAGPEAGDRENGFANRFHVGGMVGSIYEKAPKNWRDPEGTVVNDSANMYTLHRETSGIIEAAIPRPT